MQMITTIDLDIAKFVFQVHCVDAQGNAILRRQLSVGTAGILPEASAMSGWHQSMRLISSLVARAPGARPHCSTDAAGLWKPYVKRQKDDAPDAEAICEAVSRPNMRFVATKTPEQQICLMLHRTQRMNADIKWTIAAIWFALFPLYMLLEFRGISGQMEGRGAISAPQAHKQVRTAQLPHHFCHRGLGRREGVLSN